MQEFVYYNEKGLSFPLHEQIHISTDFHSIDNCEFLVSNSPLAKAHVTSPIIDFYIQNSKDEINDKIKNISKLYEIAATKYDYSQDISFTQEVGKELLLITNQEAQKEAFLSKIDKNKFSIYSINEEMLKSINGHIGKLAVTVDDEGKKVLLNVSQIAWFSMKDEGKKQSGCFDPIELGLEECLKVLENNIKSYEYKKITSYDKTICQYHERREEVCSKCEEVCPTNAILKDDGKKLLTFSQIDCHGCGGCISVCPSGALEYAPLNRESFFELSKFYENTHPLIIPQKMDTTNLNIELKKEVLPFGVDGEKFLDESHFLTLGQISGSQILFYTDFLSKGANDAIRITNEIYQKKYGKQLVIVCKDEKELKKGLKELSFIENSKFNFEQASLKKREIVSQRLNFIVGNEDLGEVKTGEHIHYGQVKVNESNCTLCLACVGACNVGALQADGKDNSLRLNPSVCTACGYCELSCAESDCLSIEQDVIKLTPTWFKESILARDELFKCVECGVEFATAKSVEKIANMMKPMFKGDEAKIKSLYCCADCKPKVMMQSMYDTKRGA